MPQEVYVKSDVDALAAHRASVAAADTGSPTMVASVTDEDVTSDEGAWVALANDYIIDGTVVVEPDGGGAAYTEGTDYYIDYEAGRLFTIAAAQSGTIGDSTALDVDYDHNPVAGDFWINSDKARYVIVYADLDFTGGSTPTADLAVWLKPPNQWARLGALSTKYTGLVEGLYSYEVEVHGQDVFVYIDNITGSPSSFSIDINVQPV